MSQAPWLITTAAGRAALHVVVQHVRVCLCVMTGHSRTGSTDRHHYHHHHVVIHSEQYGTVDDGRENYCLPDFLTGQSEFLQTHSVTSARLNLTQTYRFLPWGGGSLDDIMLD